MSSFDVTTARQHFPALKQDQVFLDNAGGSQTLGDVIDSITQYLSKTNVQLGASYHTSATSTTKYGEGYKSAAKYINAGEDEIVIGASTTQLFMNLASALKFQDGDEIILSKLDHEANVDPWFVLADRLKLKIKWWVSDKPELKLTPENLKPLLSNKVKFVACTHVSNILGGIHDVKAIAEAVHSVGALLCVDGVSYAPHRQIDVKALGVDFYAFSWYKVYGPHVAILYASSAAQEHVKPLGHFFNPTKTLEDKIGFAGSCYEAVQAIPQITAYVSSVGFDAITAHEGRLQAILLEFLNSRDDITVLGTASADSKDRVPTVSFVVKGLSSRKVVEEAEKVSNYGFRWGTFYSNRLCDEVLGLDKEGVVRVSMVHYNTEDEIKGVVEVLKKVLP
ncbi:unnamed protein product [Periconia digitata]|uniref:Aminotransferase class V domain-containing protein n=1 Tax=Periconia digitata TaxID=1303443 RepID=A0A9W4U6D4_9PLEO|nr:unnamed protein product [Periconia digitata]